MNFLIKPGEGGGDSGCRMAKNYHLIQQKIEVTEHKKFKIV